MQQEVAQCMEGIMVDPILPLNEQPRKVRMFLFLGLFKQKLSDPRQLGGTRRAWTRVSERPGTDSGPCHSLAVSLWAMLLIITEPASSAGWGEEAHLTELL